MLVKELQERVEKQRLDYENENRKKEEGFKSQINEVNKRLAIEDQKSEFLSQQIEEQKQKLDESKRANDQIQQLVRGKSDRYSGDDDDENAIDTIRSTHGKEMREL